MPKHPIQVLFVCLGNICRSPLAELICQNLANERHISDYFHIESAGTGDWHIGKHADPRSVHIAQLHGLDLTTHQAQQVTHKNIQNWDYLIAMDHDNRLNLLNLGVPSYKILMMREFESHPSNLDNDIQAVADPYYGGSHGFEDTFQVLSKNAHCILDHLMEQRNPKNAK